MAEKVKSELKNDPEIYNYSKWIFYSCMRPKEIRHLKVQDIDLFSRQIKVPGPDGKTGDRLVPICDELHELILEMGIDKANLNYYIFGKGKMISPLQVYEDYFRRRYQKIKEHLELDYNYTLYSWKHTRVVSLITAGFDDNQVMTLTGHRDRAAFEAYKRDLIIDNTVMKKKTINF
ncbi:tyrosine-type recombinase/integrase [Sphingobacterium sp.]|uniref:tyrosine-type recombinase/integrase n=1 Tax=Sphingobacterium sp. TaxID=341027 RepID=UPI00289C1558|nr:tyrosine-type recombinase/integrase [Sphingobacterium sp.]